jgi:hypothetical protein
MQPRAQHQRKQKFLLSGGGGYESAARARLTPVGPSILRFGPRPERFLPNATQE